MGFGLTATVSRSLTDHGQVPKAPIPLLNSLGRPNHEPPPKRRRVEEPLPRKRSVRECLSTQVSPLVQRAVESLERADYHVNALAIKVNKEALCYDMLQH